MLSAFNLKKAKRIHYVDNYVGYREINPSQYEAIFFDINNGLTLMEKREDKTIIHQIPCHAIQEIHAVFEKEEKEKGCADG